MSLLQSNTTCDIYRQMNSPPAAPDVAGVPILLIPAYGDGIRQMTLPRNQLILTRIHLGLGGLFARLGASRDWASILDEYLFDAPPSTPMGIEVAGWPMSPRDRRREPLEDGRAPATP